MPFVDYIVSIKVEANIIYSESLILDSYEELKFCIVKLMHDGIKQNAKIVEDLKLKPKNCFYLPREGITL